MGAIEWRLNEINGCYNKLTDLPQITATPISPSHSPTHCHSLCPCLKSRARVSAHLIEFQLYNQTSCSLEFWVLRAQTGNIFLTPPPPKRCCHFSFFNRQICSKFCFFPRNKVSFFRTFWHFKHLSVKCMYIIPSIFSISLNSSKHIELISACCESCVNISNVYFQTCCFSHFLFRVILAVFYDIYFIWLIFTKPVWIILNSWVRELKGIICNYFWLNFDVASFWCCVCLAFN